MDKAAIDDTAWLRERSPLPIIADEFLQRLPNVRPRYKDSADRYNTDAGTIVECHLAVDNFHAVENIVGYEKITVKGVS